MDGRGSTGGGGCADGTGSFDARPFDGKGGFDGMALGGMACDGSAGILGQGFRGGADGNGCMDEFGSWPDACSVGDRGGRPCSAGEAGLHGEGR